MKVSIFSILILSLMASCQPKKPSSYTPPPKTPIFSKRPQNPLKHKTLETTEAFIKRLHKNPSTVLNEIPPKIDKQGNIVHPTPFNNRQIETRSFISLKNSTREKIARKVETKPFRFKTKALVDEEYYDEEGELITDQAFRLVDKGRRLVQNIYTMDRKDLYKGSLESSPWSDDYWPVQKGIIGYRYADSNRGDKETWKELFDYISQNPPENYIRSGIQDILSPAEKYDLLIGDPNFTLTRRMWEEGQSFFDENGSVEAWMGICDGWAPASFMFPRPSRGLRLWSYDHKFKITFYPSDIKALGSLLWARAEYESRFVGSRCDTKNPERDANGRILAQECFETNPGTWHMAVINQIGISGRSFIMDATFDYEVWNQPIYRYSFKFFNPQTGTSHAELASNVIPLNEFTNDLFSSYRGSTTKNVVGVEMVLEYIVETDPSHRFIDDPRFDAKRTVVYRYDLELNGQGKILGGEWYTNHHPDFLWNPVPKAKPTISESAPSGNWNISNTLPKNWSEKAISASYDGTPLPKIVNKLFNQASN